MNYNLPIETWVEPSRHSVISAIKQSGSFPSSANYDSSGQIEVLAFICITPLLLRTAIT